MSEFIVYGVPGSPFMRSVAAAMEEKRGPYRIHALRPGDVRERQLHPFGRIPVVDHGDFRLYETQAILRYIDAVFPNPALQPTDPKASGRMNQVIGINDWYLFPQVGRIIVFQRIVGPVLMGTTADEAVCAAAVPDAERCLGELDRVLGHAPFLAGDQLSLADLLVAPQLAYLAATPNAQRSWLAPGSRPGSGEWKRAPACWRRCRRSRCARPPDDRRMSEPSGDRPSSGRSPLWPAPVAEAGGIAAGVQSMLD